MRGTTRTVAVAALSAVALLAAGCGGGDSDDTGPRQLPPRRAARSPSAGCKPENPLVPRNTNETCGGNILDAIFTKLVNYDPEDAAPENDIAESIETTDNQNCTVKLKQGWKFHDGTEVKAKNFVDAWNYAAYAPERPAAQLLLRAHRGLRRPAVRRDRERGRPVRGLHRRRPRRCPASRSSTTTPSRSRSPRRSRTSRCASATRPSRRCPTSSSPTPRPSARSRSATARSRSTPGPRTQSIVLTKFDDYAGETRPSVDKVNFRIYEDTDAAYNDVLAGNLDVIDEIPPSALIDDKYKTDLGDRNAQRRSASSSRRLLAAQGRPERTPTRSSARPSRWRSTARRSPSRSSTAPASPPTRLRLAGRRRLQGRRLRRVLQVRPGEGQGAARRGRRLRGRHDRPSSYNADAGHKAWIEAIGNSSAEPGRRVPGRRATSTSPSSAS